MEIGGSNTLGSRGGQSVNINIGPTSTTLAWDFWEFSNSAPRMDWTTTSNSTINTDNNSSFYATSAASGAGDDQGPTSRSRPHGSGSGHDPLMARGYGEQPGLVVLQGHGSAGLEQYGNQSLYNAADGTHVHPDPHLVCLKLGKRHYFEDTAAAAAAAAVGGPIGERRVAGFPVGMKRGKALYGGGGVGAAVPVPRCQVEGCHAALVNAKDYHRRHKVCEMHSKAPKVVVSGLEQRFCQQCSR